jgi:hypothetical protein
MREELSPDDLLRAQAAARMNGEPQGPQFMPQPVVCQGALMVAPHIKICWDLYFAIIAHSFHKGIIDITDKKRFADDAMAMSLVACERIGFKIVDKPPTDW